MSVSAYLGYVNFTLNANPSSKDYVVNLREVYNRLHPLSKRSTKNFFLKSITIDQIEVCSSSRGCTPKKINEDKNQKHLNYLTVYKNATRFIKTNKANNNSKYVLLNIKGTCRIGDVEENIAIRIPKTGVVGIKIGLSRQNLLNVNDPLVDRHIHERLLYELEKMFYSIFQPLGVPGMRKGILSGMTVHGVNLHNLETGNKPHLRIKNFLQVMNLLDKELKTHYFDYQPSESKSVVRANFKPYVIGSDATFGITQWLTIDFSGVKSIHNMRLLTLYIKSKYESIIKPEIHWNANHQGPPPKSRRKKIEKKVIKNNSPKNNVNIPVYNKDKNKFYRKGKVFNCMLLNKKELSALAIKLDINDKGFKKDVCQRINDKLKK